MSQAPGEKFVSLPSITLIEPNKEFKPNLVGFYDPRFGTDTEPTYKSEGELFDGVRKFDDTYLEGKNCIFLHFKHRWLGNNKFARMVSRGHFHTKCFVSNNDFNIWDCAKTNKKDDIILYANLVDDMPIVLNDHRYSLYVVEPTLTPPELSALALSSDNVYVWKKKLERSSKIVAEAQGREVLAISMMSEAVVGRSIYSDHVKSLNKLLAQSQDKLLQTTGEKFSVILGLIDKVEEEYDIGVLSDTVMSKDVQKMVRHQEIQLKTINALTDMDEDMTGNMKRHIFDTAYRFIGGPDMRRFLNMVENGPVGALNNPSMAVLKGLENMDLTNLDKDEKRGVVGRVMNYIKSNAFEEKIKAGEENIDEVINNAVNAGMIEISNEDGKDKSNER